MNIVNADDIRKLISLDKTFGIIAEKYGHPPDWKRPQGYVSLSRIILEQQLSLASANAHFLKLSSYIPGFTPSNILKLSNEEMRACQISRQKAHYLRELSTAIIKGDLNLEELKNLPDTEVRKQLTSIKGIGNWTADIYLMFCLQSRNIFPSGDIALVNTIKELFTIRSKEEILMIADKWDPLRSLASYFLWHYYLSKRKKASDTYVPL